MAKIVSVFFFFKVEMYIKRILKGGIGKMGIYRLKVIQRGTIIVDGVDSLEEAEEYIESCNQVDDVKW